MRAVTYLLFPIALPFSVQDFNSKASDFSVELLYHTLHDSSRNLAISPYAVWSLLVTIAHETSGGTREEFTKVLKLTGDRNEVVSEFQNLHASLQTNFPPVRSEGKYFLFYDENFNIYSDTVRRLEKDFGYTTQRLSENLDFTVDTAMGTTKDNQRFDLSPRGEDGSNLTMVVGNRLHFRARWPDTLKIDVIKVNYPVEDSAIGIYMRHIKAMLRSSNFESLHASVTELPYEGGKFCMLVIRPHRGYGIEQVLLNLRGASVKDILEKLQLDAEEFGMEEIEVILPQNIITSVILNKPLSNMGFTQVFDKNSTNHYNYGDDSMYMGEIEHTVRITWAASETVAYSITPKYVEFVPFQRQVPVRDPLIYLILKKSTATVLFGGFYTKLQQL